MKKIRPMFRFLIFLLISLIIFSFCRYIVQLFTDDNFLLILIPVVALAFFALAREYIYLLVDTMMGWSADDADWYFTPGETGCLFLRNSISSWIAFIASLHFKYSSWDEPSVSNLVNSIVYLDNKSIRLEVSIVWSACIIDKLTRRIQQITYGSIKESHLSFISWSENFCRVNTISPALKGWNWCVGHAPQGFGFLICISYLKQCASFGSQITAVKTKNTIKIVFKNTNISDFIKKVFVLIFQTSAAWPNYMPTGD